MVAVVVVTILLLIYQFIISRKVIRSDYYSGEQRFLQLVAIWFLPGIGALICHLMLHEAHAGDGPAEDSTAGNDFGSFDASDGNGDGGGGE